MAGMSESPQETWPSKGKPSPPEGKLPPGPGMRAEEVAAHQSARIHRAMIEIVADRGYEAVKVREIVRLAGVSSRAFYERFESKEDCFLCTYDLIAKRAMRRMIAAQTGERDWRERPRLIFKAFAKELERDPAGSHLALAEAYLASPAALERARRNEATFVGMLAESFARTPGGVSIPPMVVEGMMSGITQVARTRLLAGRERELAGMSPALMEWALCYPGAHAGELAGLDMGRVWRDTRLEPPVATAYPQGGEEGPASGDRALILASIAKLSGNGGYDSLTVSAIRREAGISRKVFHSYFDGVEDCYTAAMKQCTEMAIAQAALAQAAGRSSPGGVYRAISALCDEIFATPIFMAICLADVFQKGSPGSRARDGLIKSVLKQLSDTTMLPRPLSSLSTEATTAATWALFHHYVVRAPVAPQVAATLAFMALAPVIGAGEAVEAIRSEQNE
jgi:AcrR family transcriptional regulator